MADAAKILVVDDDDDARQILTARLEYEGYGVVEAADGLAAIEIIASERPDVVLLDLVMPKLDGLATLARIKREGSLFIPVILLTARDDVADIVNGLDQGADEYVVKPFDQASLVARVRAMLRLKALHDQVSEMNVSLGRRVTEQVEEIRRVSRLKRFLAPQIAEAILSSPDAETALESHRREVAVLFCDLRGFTAYAEASPPDELMSFLRDYHEVVGRAVFANEGTLERFTGDAVMAFFNDPIEVPDYKRRAIKLAFDILDGTRTLLAGRRLSGIDLGVGVGIAAGRATLGRIGFSERMDYAAIGPVTNLAARLSSVARAAQILADETTAREAAPLVVATRLQPRDLKGFAKPVEVFELTRH